mgnify:CR=1 FL=1
MEVQYKLPLLVKDERQWEIWVESIDNCEFYRIVRSYGRINGKLTLSDRIIKSGKNKGKTNETSIFSQACKETDALWSKQKDTHGYYEQGVRPAARPTERYFRPMLAKTYDPSKPNSNIQFPCYIQPKLDGIRLLVYKTKNNRVVMLSRTGKSMEDHPNLQHIRLQCDFLFQRFPYPITLDGELYSNSISFEEIVSICRNKNNYTAGDQIQYHVYDIICHDNEYETFENRIRSLNTYFEQSVNIRLVCTDICENKQHVLSSHKRFVNDGFEGIMLRNKCGYYTQGKRSNDLQKFKTFIDDEFVILSVKEGTGRDINTAVFECRMNDTQTFNVRPTGTMEWRKKLLRDSATLIGKRLIVTFQEYTEHGIPRFPVGKCIRDYE